VFIRERKPNSLRSLGIAPLYLGLSCRQTAEVLPFFDEASHEAARQRYHRAQALFCTPQRRCRRTIAIDETKRKLLRGALGLWKSLDYSCSPCPSTAVNVSVFAAPVLPIMNKAFIIASSVGVPMIETVSYFSKIE
jgi:hypothetical protein